MQLTPSMLLIVCPLALLAGFIDAVAGGGGLISLPAYYIAGLPPTLAAGTNKLSALMGTLLAASGYRRAGKLELRKCMPAAVCAFIASALGVFVMEGLPDNVIRVIVLCCLPFAAALTLRGMKKPPEAKNRTRQRVLVLSLVMGLCAGFYDGLVGPGTGTMLILFFTNVFGSDPVLASGNAKVVNIASNAAALISFLLAGDVMIALGLPAAGCAMLGGALGSRVTVRRGGGFVRVMMLIVLAGLLAKMAIDMIG